MGATSVDLVPTLVASGGLYTGTHVLSVLGVCHLDHVLQGLRFHSGGTELWNS